MRPTMRIPFAGIPWSHGAQDEYQSQGRCLRSHKTADGRRRGRKQEKLVNIVLLMLLTLTCSIYRWVNKVTLMFYTTRVPGWWMSSTDHATVSLASSIIGPIRDSVAVEMWGVSWKKIDSDPFPLFLFKGNKM